MILGFDASHIANERRYKVIEEGTDLLHEVSERVRLAEDRADGTLSRMIAEAVFGAPSELCDELGWGKE